MRLTAVLALFFMFAMFLYSSSGEIEGGDVAGMPALDIDNELPQRE